MADERVELERVVTDDEIEIVRPGYPRSMGYPEGYPSYGYGYGEAEEGINVRELWRTVRKRKWLIAVIVLIVTTVVAIEAYRDKSMYQASAVIEIGKDTGTVVKLGDLLLQTDDFNSQVGIKTSMLILKSRPVLEGVVAELKLDENPKFLDVGSRKSVWEAIAALSGRAVSTESNEEAPPVVVESSAAPQSFNSENSPEEIKRLTPFVNVLSGYLAVDQIRETRALKVSFTHTNPTIARAVANGVAKDFTERSFQSKTERFQTTSDWLKTSTRELEAKVQEAEQQLADYTREHNIFSTDTKETLTTDKLTRLHDQSTRAETERIIKQSLYEEVKAGRVNQLPEAFADAKIGEYEKKLAELAVRRAQLDLKYGEDNPQVKEVNEQIAVLEMQIRGSRKSLEEKLKAEYDRAARDEQTLKGALERAKSEAVNQNQASIQFSILKQNVDTAKALYVDFLQRYNQSKIEVAQQHNNLRIIEPAQTPTSPIGPQRTRTILVGLLLSLAAGVGLAFFLEYLDNTIKTVEDVNRYAQLPALSVIPAIAGNTAKRISGKHKNGKAIGNGSKDRSLVRAPSELVALDNRSSAAEAYRVLRTSVLLSAAGNPPKRILVTSGQPGEGKTTTVVNTAVSLAQLGASVLIIDCDLRKPTAHKLFGLDHVRGLSTYLSRDVNIDGLIQKLQIPNLYLLPCGPIPPNPAELISSEKMKEMLKMLGDRFDHILIDSPPLINVTDPVILSTLVDGVILVVHGGRSTRGVVSRARHELVSVGAKIFGVVLNNVDLKREGYDDYYYYRYYQGYGVEAETPGD
ncbi:MAG TPA: polysaccharide biosynthesis tyrosine autokinase [Blastocatellia bacterium]|jgi:capsular exopolysaccharide synthesis family protein|nr:polysaccharide biosynthesis tyrosine autokinase [Blastocatellia bacterium]